MNNIQVGQILEFKRLYKLTLGMLAVFELGCRFCSCIKSVTVYTIILNYDYVNNLNISLKK